MNKNENLWRILQMTNEWVRYSDTKAVTLLGVQGILLGFLMKSLGDAFSGEMSLYLLFLILIAFALNIASVVFAFLCINPQLNSQGSISPIYFGSIANHFKDSGHYYEHFSKTFDEDDHIAKELCSQVYINSCTANKKFCRVTYSLRFFVGSLFCWMSLLFFLV